MAIQREYGYSRLFSTIYDIDTMYMYISYEIQASKLLNIIHPCVNIHLRTLLFRQSISCSKILLY